MKKLSKKLSLFLSIIMLFTVLFSSYAFAITSTDLQTNTNPKLDIQDMFEETGALVDNVLVDKVKGEKSFKVTFNDGIVNYIVEKPFKNGDVQYVIKDDTITNTIDIKGDSVYLNGKEVIYSEKESNLRVEATEEYSKNELNSIVGPATVGIYHNSTSPFVSGGYNKNVVSSNEVIGLPEPIKNLLKGAIATLIGYVNAYAGVAAYAFDLAYTIIKAANPNTTSLYYKRTTWESNDYYYGQLHYEHLTEWYTHSTRLWHQLAESKTTYTMIVL